MQQTIESVRLARAAAIPVIGYTLFPVFSMVDGIMPSTQSRLPTILFNLVYGMHRFTKSGSYKRTDTPLADAYRRYVRRGAP